VLVLLLVTTISKRSSGNGNCISYKALKTFAADIETIEINHWDNKRWGETPADFGRK
jgi:hypothetical protein